MGKRELLIALAFVVVGVCVFHFSAPPPKPGDTGFSFATLISRFQHNIRSQSYTAPVRSIAVPIDAGIDEIRFANVNGSIRITGAARQDAAIDLSVSSTGDSEAAAFATANKVTLSTDRVGSALVVGLDFPSEESQTASIVVQLPARLAVRLDAPRDPVITNVRAVEFQNPARGAVELTHIAEGIRGDQTGGSLTVDGAGGMKMLLTRVRTRVTGLTADTSLEIRDGQFEIAGSRGALELDTRRGVLTIHGQQGPIRVSGSDGQVHIEAAQGDVRLDLQRTRVDAELHAGSPATIVTTDAVRVALPDPAGVRIEAAVTNGAIDAADWGLTPSVTGKDARLTAALGAKSAAAPIVTLRTQGANIVIKKSSKK